MNNLEFNTNHGTITNTNCAVDIINRLSDENYTKEDVVELVNKSTDVTYVSNGGQPCSKEIAAYKLIKLDVFSNSGQYIYLSMYKTSGIQGQFKGHYIGTYERLIQKICDNSYIVKGDESVSHFTGVMNDLYSRLLNKEYWKSSTTGDASRLISYLYAMFNKCVNSCHSTPEVLSTSKDSSRVCFNTKLIDVYGSFLYLACDVVDDEAENYRIQNPQILVSKSDFVNAGFDSKATYPAPVNFFSELSDVVFKGTLEDFDLDDTRRLDHLVADSRKNRLPARYQNITNVDMANCVKYSVEMALKLLVTDYRHIVPMYNVSRDEIQFMLPLYLDRRYAEIPEVALIVSKDARTGLYVVNTMISIDAAYVNSRTLSASTANWLERGVMQITAN